ncbi:hypothetical protein ABLG96_00415 [Nakamurella sp. A5-74]|uniref:Integral membrane protein n=1 Tax=Nakamurella sp. A5-74 TaxID=3158264 RepID=A0AAU8DQ46_9ACTN
MTDQIGPSLRWVAARMGVMFGILMGAFGLVMGENSLAQAGILGTFTALAFGFGMYWILKRQRRIATQRLGPLAELLDRKTVRDAVRGPVAADEAERADQLQIVELQISELKRTSVSSSIVLVAGLVLEVALAITTSAWFWLAASVFAALAGLVPLSAKRLRRRREVLIAAP